MEVKEYVEKFLEAYKLLKKKKMRPTDAEEIAIEIMKEHAKDRRAENISKELQLQGEGRGNDGTTI